MKAANGFEDLCSIHFDTLVAEAGDAERITLLEQAYGYILEIRAAGFQRFAVKPLTSLGFRLAMREVKAQAKAEGFDPEELADELRVFQRAFEARILYRA